MPVTSVEKDLDALTLTITADFAAPLERVWDAYLDPRQIERFWGPPEFPSTFFRHDGAVGGRSVYAMTNAQDASEQHFGVWEWTAVDPGRGFTVVDSFADAAGNANTDLPSMTAVFAFSEHYGGTRLVTTSTFSSAEQFEQVLAMGVEEGTRSAMGQIDAVLADLRSFAASVPTEAQLLSDTKVRVARVIRGSLEQVWRAYHEPELMTQWLLGPDGWIMPTCVVAQNVGDTYINEWSKPDGSEKFGFTGELLESAPPYREVTTESMISQPGATTNELTFTPVEGGTLMSLVITYPNAEFRDMVLATGMTGGMETSFARLEALLGQGAFA